jgi:exodeoxyribonuclease V alpha subunit
MPAPSPSTQPDTPTEALSGAVERVTFHSEETGFCVLHVQVRGHRDSGIGRGSAGRSHGEMCTALACMVLFAVVHMAFCLYLGD